MCEDEALILLERELVLLELVAVWEIHATQLGLDEQRSLMGWKCDVNFDWKPDAVRSIDFFVYRFFA